MLSLRRGLCRNVEISFSSPFIDLPPTQKPMTQFPPLPLMTQTPKVLSLKTWIYLCFFLRVGWMIHFVPWRCFQMQNCYIRHSGLLLFIQLWEFPVLYHQDLGRVKFRMILNQVPAVHIEYIFLYLCYFFLIVYFLVFYIHPISKFNIFKLNTALSCPWLFYINMTFTESQFKRTPFQEETQGSVYITRPAVGRIYTDLTNE